LNLIALQGTKILGDREIRYRRCAITKDTPRTHTFTRIIKYTGTLASPEWKDIEPGRVFSFPRHLVKNAQSQKDKFEMLCRVVADISGAPCTSKLAGGKKTYRRDYDIILLVGLTELKAQIGWINSKTVRARFFLRILIYPIRLPHM